MSVFIDYQYTARKDGVLGDVGEGVRFPGGVWFLAALFDRAAGVDGECHVWSMPGTPSHDGGLTTHSARRKHPSRLDAAGLHEAAPVAGGQELPVEPDAPHGLVRNRLNHQHIRH
jgi:hypothetical protein